jgi:hypothetical protein
MLSQKGDLPDVLASLSDQLYPKESAAVDARKELLYRNRTPFAGNPARLIRFG